MDFEHTAMTIFGINREANTNLGFSGGPPRNPAQARFGIIATV